MADNRHQNVKWVLAEHPQVDQVQIAVLMDIRDELQTLNAVFRCRNFLEIPVVLRAIRRNTAKPRKKTKRSKA